MKWVTRQNANVDRIACPWLIRRFIDPDAEFLFVPRDQVLETADRQGAHSYDAPGARYTHRDGKCSFDVLVEAVGLAGDPALIRLAEVVHAADIAQDRDSSPEGRGLHAIAHGFALLHGTEDHKKIELETPLYDALYTWWAPWRNMRQRNIGWRLDYVLASHALAARTARCVSMREYGTSDHAPVVATFAEAS